MEIAGKTVLVTGANRGLGAAIANPQAIEQHFATLFATKTSTSRSS